MEQLDIVVASAFGVEAVVARELRALGYDAKPTDTGRIAFRGDELAVCRSNLRLRSADRVQVRVLEVDLARQRISLTMKLDAPAAQAMAVDNRYRPAGRGERARAAPSMAAPGAMAAAFAKLQGRR